MERRMHINYSGGIIETVKNNDISFFDINK